MWLDFVECLLQVVDDIVDMLGADAQTNGGRCDVLLGQFLGRELRVCGGVGVYHQTLPFTSKVKMEPPPWGKYFL